jgi:hypothetical protein
MKVLELKSGEPDMEENKVARKLAAIIDDSGEVDGRALAGLILQSQDLRVEIVGPRYELTVSTSCARVMRDGVPVAEFFGETRRADAEAYIASKEPK